MSDRFAPVAGMRAGEALRLLAGAFRAAGLATPALDARVLLLEVLRIGHAALIAAPERPLTDEEAARLSGFVVRRLSGEPVSRILGRREFYGRDFCITPDVLDPRPDTEILVEAALEMVRRRDPSGAGLFLLDAGSGSGAVIVTLLAELPQARGVALDISAAALAVTLENARMHGVRDRLLAVCGSWLDPFVEEAFDLIVSNPPYIPDTDVAGLDREVAGYDPHLALAGGADGLDAYRMLTLRAASALRNGGHLIVEVGIGQVEDVRALFAGAGLAGGDGPWVRHDLAGVPRVVVAEKG